MLFKMDKVYIDAQDELDAYAKFVNYRLDEAAKGGYETPRFDVSKGPQELSIKTAEEYFMPVFEKVCEMYPGAYFDDIMPGYELCVVLKDNEETEETVLFVLYATETEGVFEVSVGIDSSDDVNLTILSENPYGGNFLKEVSEAAEEYLSKI